MFMFNVTFDIVNLDASNNAQIYQDIESYFLSVLSILAWSKILVRELLCSPKVL